MSQTYEQTKNENETDNAIFDISVFGNSELKQLTGMIKEINDDATFEITEEGITFRSMDPSHVCLLDIAWPNVWFEKFQVSKPGKFGVRAEEFWKLVKDLGKKDTIRLSADNQGMLTISTKTSKTMIKLIESSASDTPLPKITYNATIGMNFESIKKALKQIEVLSEYVTFKAMDKQFVISGKGDNGSNELRYEKGMIEMPEIEVKEDSETTYGLGYILPFIKHLKVGSLMVEYSSKMPLRLEAKMFNNSFGRVHIYLAPRVES